jgi:hypothetical protein
LRCDGFTPLVLRLSDREFSSPEGDQQSEVNQEQHRHSKAPRTKTSTLLVQFSALRVGCRATGADADCDFQRAGWGATIILAGGTTNMMAGGEESKAA